MESFINYLPLIGVPSTLALVGLIIKSIALIKTSSVERVLLNTFQRLVTSTIEIIYASLAVAYIGICIAIFVNSEININTTAALFLFVFVCSLIAIPLLIYVIKSITKKWYHYIKYLDPESKKFEKYYIRQVTHNGDIILSKENRKDSNYVILIKKDDILKTRIYREYI